MVGQQILILVLLAGVDYIIESGSDNIYFNEMNTACGIYGSYNEQMSIVLNQIADYAKMKKVAQPAYVYGQDDSQLKESLQQFNNH